MTARRAALLCMALFLLQPLQFGIWLSRISEVQAALQLPKSHLAFALLGMPCGLLPTLYFAGSLVDRIGSRNALLWAFAPMLCAGLLPGLAGGAPQLFLGLMMLGAVFAFTEIGLNVLAAETEKTHGITIMNRAHGFWSLGVMVGSLLGVQLAALGLKAFAALGLSALVVLPLALAVARQLPKAPPQPIQTSQTDLPAAALPKGLFLVVLVVFGATITEGAMADWATVYMREAPWGGTAMDGLAVTVYSGAITTGRFLGDAVSTRFGPAILARTCLSLALTGVILLVISGALWMSFLGFGLVGLGISTIFPLGVSATARLSPTHQARNISVLTFGALSGFLIAPPLIGFVAEATSVAIGFCLLLPALALSLTFAHKLATREGP